MSTSTSEEKLPAAVKEAIARTKDHITLANESGNSRFVFIVEDIELLLRMATSQTPSSQWGADGREDPHKDLIERERHQLPMGHLTDDELANGAYLNYDRKLSIDELMRGVPASIAWMTAVKERIRWLSRSLEASVNRDKCRGDI